MGTIDKTSNVAVVVIAEKTSRTAINNYEAHIKQYILTGNAHEEYKKYNYSFPTELTGVRYRKVIDEHLKKGMKFDKNTLKENDFWIGRTYKKGSGKTTTYIESMTIAPPFKIHPSQVQTFLQSNENNYFSDVVNFLKADEKFKDCIFLDFIVHMDEIYVPESITLSDGTEKMLSLEEQWEQAYIKPHMHISYIPTVKAHDEKTSIDYLKLSRKEIWHSDKGFRKSYSEFIDRKYEAVDREYDLDRGELYDDMDENEKSIHLSLEEWRKKNDQERIERLISQQKKENEVAFEELQEQIKRIQKQEHINEEAAKSLEDGFEAMISDMIEDFDGEYEKMDYVLLKAEKKMLVQLLDILGNIIKPLRNLKKTLFDSLQGLIDEYKQKMQATEKIRTNYLNRTNHFEER